VSTTWWLPYDFEAIVRYGHAVNSSIPEDPNEAEFPPTPWADRVVIRGKTSAGVSRVKAEFHDTGERKIGMWGGEEIWVFWTNGFCHRESIDESNELWGERTTALQS
jgi:hypothetical protein